MLFRVIIYETHMKHKHTVAKVQFLEVKVGDTYNCILCLPTFKRMNMICTSNCNDIYDFMNFLNETSFSNRMFCLLQHLWH
jgi:hypothetical protein